MILDTITLCDFGVFGGRQEVILTPPDGLRPVVLFGGLNGAGKTTLLDAVQLALYGSQARCSGRGSLSYRDYLADMVHRGASMDRGASVALRFRRREEGEFRDYRVVRSWRDSGRGVTEDLTVSVDGADDAALAQHWNEYVEGHMPVGIAHLFFFDAEQIRDLADGKHAAGIVGTAVHALLGLDLVNQLTEDLMVLERRKRSEAVSASSDPALQEADTAHGHATQLLDRTTQERAALQNTVDTLARQLAACEEAFRRKGGELYLRRQELLDRATLAQSRLTAVEEDLRGLAAGPAPLLLAMDLLVQTEAQARREESAHRAAILGEVLEERDRAVLALLAADGLSVPHLERIGQRFCEDRQVRQADTATPVIVQADEGLADQIRYLREAVLPGLRTTIEERIAVARRCREDLEQARDDLARVPADEAVADLVALIESLRGDIRAHEIRRQALEERIQLLERERAEAARRVAALQMAHLEASREQEGVARILKHATKARGTLDRFRAALIRRHVERLERLTLDSFRQLLRKADLVTGLRIDPETFMPQLAGADGKPLPMERLSSGERQLLATAMLWGLARASGKPLPMIIDTPLGRLDSSHRRHLVERYFPMASHQVVLLSTDEEVTRTHLDRLKPHIGRSYRLVFDEDRRSSRVEEGYFGD